MNLKHIANSNYIIPLVFFILLSYQMQVLGQDKVFYSNTISLNGEDWKIAIDSQNKGVANAWFITLPEDQIKKTIVPWVIQDVFKNYHGIAWYWRTFYTPENSHQNGKFYLRFSAVDYKADVWLNGKYLGNHEGGETSFEFEVSDILVTGRENRLSVRVLNPTYEAIEGIVLKETPSGAKNYPVGGNAAYNSGGIVGDVDLLVTPVFKITDIHVIPNWQTGKIIANTSIYNAGDRNLKLSLICKVKELATNNIVGV